MDWINFLRVEEIGSGFFFSSTLLLLVVLIAILLVTGLALYKAARLNDQTFFWFIFIFNTAGILPLIYLYIKRKEKPHYLWGGRK